MSEPTYSPNRLRNTNRLVRLMYAKMIATDNDQPSASELYGLAKLAWITKGNSADTYITGAKIPALEQCLGLPEGNYNKQKSSEELEIFVNKYCETYSDSDKHIILNTTGFTNIYNAYRNSCHAWINDNIENIRSIYLEAFTLVNDDDNRRLEIYSSISVLEPIPKPNNRDTLSPASLLTPVIFCLDPYLRSPVLNKSNANQAYLKNIGANLLDLRDCASRMIAEIDQNNKFADAADLDFYIQTGISRIQFLKTEGNHLRTKDDKDREVIVKGGSQVATQLHNTLTNELIDYLAPRSLLDGDRLKCRFDALIPKDQTARGRHLLIEVKSSNETPNIRLAIGQLLHYKYNLSSQYSDPELAILVPNKPEEDIIKFLIELDIYTIWGRDTDWNITGRNINEVELINFLDGTR